MRSFILSVIFILSSAIGFAQVPAEFKEGQPLMIEGVEFIYTVGVEEVKTLDGSQYSFFTLDWYITNKGKFSKIFLLERDKIVESPEFDMSKKAYLGKIHIINGLQLETTAKFCVISAEPNMEILAYSKMLIGNKKKMLPGFNLQSGQTISQKIQVAVPKGQRPVVSLQPFISPFY